MFRHQKLFQFFFFCTVEYSALRRYAINLIDHYEGVVFWARDYFDQFDRSTFYRNRFNVLYYGYERLMGQFVEMLDDLFTDPTLSYLQTEARIQLFFQDIERLVNPMTILAQMPGISRRS